MSHPEANSSGSSEWQTYSEESLAAEQNLSVEGATRTLNFRPDDLLAHEPFSVVRPLSIRPAFQSIEPGPRNQLTPSISCKSLQKLDTKRLSRDRRDPQPRTSIPSARTDASRPVFLLPTPTYHAPSVADPANFAGMDTVDVPQLVDRLGSEEDAVRKMAVFKLQSNIGDPSFAETFIQEGGLQRLRYLVMHATGNTLAYSLTSFSRLLEVDKGWDLVERDLIERVRT